MGWVRGGVCFRSIGLSLVHLLVTLGLWIVGAPAVLACLYLFVLTLLSAKAPLPPPSTREMRFDLIVPAHNEEAVIANVIRSLQAVDWPADRFRVVVVADNCTDSTAAVARAAGAHVLERFDRDQRGKGYALQFAFKASR